MRKALTLLGTGLAAALALTACGGGNNASAPSAAATLDPANPTTVTVGATPTPQAKILEFVDQKLAKEAGIDLEIKEFDDYQTPNIALSDGSLDANYFQHLPFLEDQMKTKGYKFEHGAPIHIEPYAGFSAKHKKISEIPDGATIAITNDPGNQPRALKLLESAGLLKDIKDDSSALTLSDEQNPKKLKFEENQPEILLPLVKDPKIDMAIINGNYILDAGLNTDDALVVESVKDSPYGNFLVWRAGEETPAIAKLEELLHSPEVKAYIEKTWPNGDVTPAF
ncbi:MetQ/NlpA family ABC transporter substrate-binding protein [Arthrobacter sp. I2-34]|uniref:Lipoprotein n=1 Tax=Arthrobacter hankyongi TaxID=2904801 RepID=A0ABS9L868_9MICC|nr:MetQ/NlpA family ABC transporter substrate-binding protein [Arthrobacter hankyongi]MCG2622783.1 MetQ/NlpA family ABC transporter substrate-binding protein [Arthrobacter hankyongi]